jgi:hypothetical protein
MGLVLLGFVVCIAVRAWLDRHEGAWAMLLVVVFAAVAGMLTWLHWYEVDSYFFVREWQEQLYLDILNHARDAEGQYRTPHQFRSLPYGFTRALEVVSGDWFFSCVTYRWFFTFWFLWFSYRFARLFHGPTWAFLVVLPVVLLYPLSVEYYWGQLTDPLSHALFVLALIYVVQDRWGLLLLALMLGVIAKETVVLVVPAYLACYGRQGWRAWTRTMLLGLGCIIAFLAVRLPLGWRPGNSDMNGLDGLMIGTNLGIGVPLAKGQAPLYENYLQPLWFVGVFLPAIAWRWRTIPRVLKALCLTLTPLLLLSNLCFGWMYESRNYMPLVPLLATMALPMRRAAVSGRNTMSP